MNCIERLNNIEIGQLIPFVPKVCMFNVPYGDNDYYDDYKKEKEKRESMELQYDSNVAMLMKKLRGDIPNQNNLNKQSKLCGYIEIDGTYHQCNSCEHERFIRKLIYENDRLRKMYFEIPASFYNDMPRGMLQEEYFAMKYLGFVKISSFKETPTDMVVFFYNPLTYKQSDIVYPR